jgi:hypothetical protein
MSQIDPEQERRRLVEFYSHQLDGELEQVASQADELTEVARGALRSELLKRGLSAELPDLIPVTASKVEPVVPADPSRPQPPKNEAASPHGELEIQESEPQQLEPREWVTIRQFRDLPEALLAKGCLESAGIEVVLGDDNMVRMDWFISNFIGGVKLRVRPVDAAIAQEILEQPIPPSIEVAGFGEYQQPHCPRCQSLDVTFQELDKPVAYVSAYFSVPIPLKRKAWRCRSCSAEWEDDGVTETPESLA